MRSSSMSGRAIIDPSSPRSTWTVALWLRTLRDETPVIHPADVDHDGDCERDVGVMDGTSV